jgi:hypothetical protein
MKKLSVLYVLVLLYTANAYGQYYKIEPSFFKLTQLSGEVRLSGTYNYGENIINGENNEVKNSLLSAGIFLFTKSYMYHPNLLSLDISGGYEPKLGEYQELVRPDYSINGNQKFVRANAFLFKRLNYNLQTFVDFNENYSNRENFTSVKSVNKSYGGIFSLNNKFAPASIRYSNVKQDQLEIQSNRNIVREEETIEGIASKKHGEKSQSSINIRRRLYKNSIIQDSNQSDFDSKLDDYTFQNTLQLSKKMDGSLRSRVNYYTTETNQNVRDRFSINTNLLLELPYNLDVQSNYQYNQLNSNNQSEKNHQIFGSLTHRLYESLTSNLFIDFKKQNQSFFNESNTNFGFNIAYNKEIPFNSRLKVNYSFRNSLINRNGEVASISVFDETLYISDDQINIIDNANVTIATITVKDALGTIIYQENLDYFLVELGGFIEIKRIPGGLISNNSSVLVDYVFIQPEAYDLNNSSNNFRIAIEMLTNTFQIYYNYSSKEYRDRKFLPYLKLDFFNRNIYGGKLDFGFINAGVEYDDFDSNIVPFRLINYNANLTGRFKNRIRYNISYNSVNYLMIAEEGRTQRFDYLTGNVSYFINYSTNLNLNVAYRSQQVDELDLGWLTGRLEFTTRIKQLEVRANLNYYKREFVNQNSNFYGASIQLSRRF